VLRVGMHWIFYGVASPAVYAAVNHLDAHIVSKRVKGPEALPLYTALVVLAIALAAFALAGAPNLGLAGALLTASGFLVMMAYVFYFRAIALGDPAFVSAMFQVSAVFTLILARVFLDERLSASRWAGFVLVLGAAIALSLERVEGRFRLGKAFWPIVAADLFTAAATVVVKQAFMTRSFLPIVAYEGFGVALGGAAVALSGDVRAAFRTSLRESGPRVIALVCASEGMSFLGRALFFLGVSLGPVAIVSALGGVQPFFSLGWAYALALLLPGVFPRPRGGAHLARRLALSGVLLAGIWLCR
jgi:transporter family protein